MSGLTLGSIFAAVVILFEVIGVICAVFAILASRTPQGAIAWAIALISMPLIAVPLYLVLGRSKFNGIVSARRAGSQHLMESLEEARPKSAPFVVDLESRFADARVLSELAHLPFLRGNQTKLLVDGEETFAAIFSAISRAEEYVLAQFFIIHDDELGRQFKEVLIDAAKRGCRVYLLYDEVGSQKMTRQFINDLTEAGVQVSGFKTTKGWFNRFQLNFRNHRKIVIVDGHTALVGGHNVGDEYVHKSKRLTPWRDTHMVVEGPAVLPTQLTFVEDWHWATEEIPKLNWQPKASVDGDKYVFVLPSGPDEDYETCGLFFTHAINSAKERLWIASPYFVPDEGIVKALQLAAIRGVDVRIMIPGLPDKWLVKRAAMAYVPRVEKAGVKIYEFGKGFLHQKVILIDDFVSVVGTANFDNRSFRLNFEISMITIDDGFTQKVEDMLINDFENSTLIDPADFAKRGLFFKVTSQIARLFAPIL